MPSEAKHLLSARRGWGQDSRMHAGDGDISNECYQQLGAQPLALVGAAVWASSA